MNIVLVMLGAAVGAALRHLVGRGTLAVFGPGYPIGTLAVNLVGGLAMGLLTGVLARGHWGESARLLMGVGVLGGFTTFSAFSLDVAMMIERGNLATAAGYVLMSVFGSIVALFAGLYAVRALA